LKVYVRRIEELAAIMRSAQPKEAALTEWLVRCAEEPATRWEGAYELASDTSLPQDAPEDDEADEGGQTGKDETATEGATVNDDKKASEDDRAVSPAEPAAGAGETVAVESNDQVVAVSPESKAASSINFAALLTPAQKERLTNVLLNAEELDLGEQVLMVLVGSWKDERLVPFMLKRLARAADKPPYHAEDMMRIVAYTLDDQTLIKFVANYRKNVTYNDLYADDPAEVAAYEEDPEATPEQRAERKKETEETRAAAAEALFRRSGQVRHFLALADQPQKP
jgi:hypothetical protein